MNDENVAALLDSDDPLVVIEAPAGCGKTYQGACYARRAASKLDTGRVLILTHTHAACGVFESATQGRHQQVEVRTIDSMIVQIASVYHRSLDLPPDPYGWARQSREGISGLASRVAALLQHSPMISEALADRYPVVIGDEHQDSSSHQDAIMMSLGHAGSKLRIFGDPMQRIYIQSSRAAGDADRQRWEDMKANGSYMELETPHRWKMGSPELGEWILSARDSLREGNAIDLTSKLPNGLEIVRVANRAKTHAGYQLTRDERKPMDRIVRSHSNLLILTSRNETVNALAAFWGRQIPIWEGHKRDGLETLVDELIVRNGDAVGVAEALVKFLGKVAVGFSPSSHGNRLIQEIAEGCTARVRGKPALIQELGRFLLEEPNSIGVSRFLMRLSELSRQRVSGFDSIYIDYRREYKDAERLKDFSGPASGLYEINRRRSFARPMPPPKAISTIHKAKGLECDNAIVIPCDRQAFSSTEYARCKLYVALSRAKRNLTLLISTDNPSPLFQIG